MDLLNVVIRADTSGSDRAEASLDKVTAAARQSDAALSDLGNASSSASAKMAAAAARAQADVERLAGAAKYNTAGLAAQFQDIGVTAAMGMNPLMIALQQGTQLTGQLATMDRPLQMLGQSLLSLASPLSLVTLALVALLAVGLQMVNWGDTAEVVLDTIANALVPIAPYAAAAAIGLALLYAPAIIAGIGAAIGMIGSMASAMLGLAASIYATVGLPALLIAGFVALVAAAVIWRDDLTKMLGFDIVSAAQDGVNFIVGLFVGAFNAVKDVWGLLPGAFADIFTMAMNGAIDIVQNGINGITGALRNIPGLGDLKDADLSGYKGEVTGAAGDAASAVQNAFSSAQGVNYVGEAAQFVQTAASGAADALHGLADAAGAAGEGSKKAATEAKRQAEAYQDIVRGAEQHIASAELEVQSIGLTEEATARMRYEQELLNKAANDNIALTPAQIEQIDALAASMAEADQVLAGVQLAVGNPEPWAIMRDELASLDAALAKGKISLTQYQAAATRSMAGATGATIDSIGQITGVLAGAFEDNKALAIANAVVSTAGGVMKALEQGGMFGWPMAAAIAAAGAVQIGTIMSASPGGGSSARAPSAPAAATVQNAPQRQTSSDSAPQRMEVTIQGLDRSRLYDGETLERLIEALSERSQDGQGLDIRIAS